MLCPPTNVALFWDGHGWALWREVPHVFCQEDQNAEVTLGHLPQSLQGLSHRENAAWRMGGPVGSKTLSGELPSPEDTPESPIPIPTDLQSHRYHVLYVLSCIW